MEITIFAKKRKTKDGKSFYSYLTTLTRKNGENLTTQVKFREDCGSPKADLCPMNIVVEKGKANLSSKDFIREDTGETCKSFTLWVSEWAKGSEYIDTSLDDFE